MLHICYLLSNLLLIPYVFDNGSREDDEVDIGCILIGLAAYIQAEFVEMTGLCITMDSSDK
jgi:hypothetical protein